MQQTFLFAICLTVVLPATGMLPKSVPKSECKQVMDMVYVVDGSDSISDMDYSKQRHAIKDMIERMDVGENASRVGLVVFSTGIAQRVNLTGSYEVLRNKSMGLEHPRDGTETHVGIDAMAQMFEDHGRKEVPWVCIVITDGRSKDPGSTAKSARKAKKKDINMFAVGISNDIRQDELDNIASSKDQVLKLQTFDQLQVSLMGLMKFVCPCPDPPLLPNGVVKNGSRSIGSKRTYVCLDGYQPIGKPRIKCENDSTWTTLEFSCNACPNPIPVYRNGYVTDGLNVLGSTRQYLCEKGYTSPDPLIAVCEAGTKGPYWKMPDKGCLACPKPPQLRNGHLDIKIKDRRVGATRIYHCDEGFIATGTIETTCMDEKGFPRWTKPKHRCIACKDPPRIDFADVRNGANLIGTVRTYDCIPGYHPTGPIEAVCMGENGATFWKTSGHFCTACKVPPHVPNAVLLKGGDNLVGSTRTYKCLKGFQPTGLIEVKCMKGIGEVYWDGPKHRCQACPLPPALTNAILDPVGDNLVGSLRKYSCMKGFIPNGLIEVGCIEGTGGPSWTSPGHRCIACPTPPPVLHALMDQAGDNLIGSKRLYHCKKGYIPSVKGPIIRECLGEWDAATLKGRAYWSDPSHYCRACPEPPKIEFAEVEQGDTLIGSSRSYVCLKGFYATGQIKIRCMKDGTWTKPKHSCTACGPVPNVEHADVDDGLHHLGTTRYYKCHKGYTHSATPSIVCLKDAQWSPVNFSCVACKNPYGLKNAVLEPGDNLIGTPRTYTCLPGYLATGPITSTCAIPPKKMMPDWSTPVHYCKDCGDPHPVENAFALKGQRTIGAMQHYVCKEGYVPSAKPVSHCMPNAEWTPPEFVCIVCKAPPKRNNAVVDTVGNNMVGNIRTYKCNSGYLATGPIEVICYADQKDGHPPPYWKKLTDNYCTDCGVPPNVTHAIWLTGAKTIGSTARYVCESGYVPSSTPEIVCGRDAVWDKPAFNCTGCTITPDVQYAVPVAGVKALYTTGSIITYECISGYVAIGTPELVCQKDATWSSKEFYCIRTCGEPDIYIDAVVDVGGNLQGDIRHYTCNKGLKTVGDASVTCLESGLWSPRQFECAKCLPASELPYAIRMSDETLIGSEVMYQCEDGYISDGPVVSTCLMDLTWSPANHSCYGCSTTPVIKNTLPITAEAQMYKIGTILAYQCLAGHVATGVPELRCRKDGTWSKQKFQCILSCGEPPSYAEAVLENGGTLMGDVRRYKCIKGLKTEGEPTVTCLPSGIWSPRYFNCTKCMPAPELDYAIPLPGDSFIGSEVVYKCKEGLISDGPVVSVCKKNLRWSTPKNKCHDCGVPPNVPHAYLTLGKSTIGAIRRYTCDANYDMSGSKDTIECLPSGKWSVPQFSCYVRTTTTTTTPAPVKGDPSVCDRCRMFNGVGYIGHPFDCTQFVQCYYSQRGVEAVYQPCPFGQYWDQADLTCKPAEVVDCPVERCLNPKLKSYKHTDSEKCCAFWVCINGKSVAKCCGKGYKFEDERGCVKDPTCNALCPWEDEVPVCDKRPVHDISKYEQHVGNGHWLEMPCGLGTGFNIVDCGCTLNIVVVPGFACKPEILLDFDRNVIDDASGRNVHIHNEGVYPYKGAAYFNGKSRLVINRFSNTEFRGHLVVKLRYKEQLQGPTGNMLQALITNGDCGDDPSIIVAKMPGFVLLGAKTDRPKSFALPTLPKDWKEVIYIHNEKRLEGKVCGASYSKWSWGPIRSTHCGIQIGHGTNLFNYTGLIDDITLYQCRPQDSILTVYGGRRRKTNNKRPPILNVH